MPAIDDGAVFALTRVRAAHRPRLLASIVALAIVGLIAVGALDRRFAPSPASVTAATTAPIATLRAQTGRSSRPPPIASLGGRGISQRFDPAFPNLIVTEASQNGPISVLATRRPSMVTVYGAVNLQQVTRVLVTMQSLDGQPAGSTSAVVPESSGEGKDHLPPLGFNLQLAVPTELVDRILVVQTSAYDKLGRLLATTRSELAPEQ